MSFVAVLLIAVGVSIDAFAVSVSGALCDRTGRKIRNAAWAALFFGGFQILMPLLGFAAAALLQNVVRTMDHWLAFALLGFVGGKMIFEGLRKEEEKAGKDGAEPCCPPDFFAPRALFLPAIATSLDALAVGAGLAFAGSGIWIPALAMGVVTAAASAIGVLIGVRLGSLAGERVMMVIGGCASSLSGSKSCWSISEFSEPAAPVQNFNPCPCWRSVTSAFRKVRMELQYAASVSRSVSSCPALRSPFRRLKRFRLSSHTSASHREYASGSTVASVGGGSSRRLFPLRRFRLRRNVFS